MSQYNAIGMPYSDELYHHGIQGMHWYVRRYQNADGSLTEEGRKRYSKNSRPASVTDTGTGNAKRMKKTVNEIVSKNGKQNVRKNGVPSVKGRVASGAKAVGATAARGASRLGEGIVRGVKMKLAEKFPFMLNDEEIAKYRERLQLENTYRNAMAERRSAKNRSKGDQFISNLAKDTISNTVRAATNKVVNKALDEALKTRDEREAEEMKSQTNRMVYNFRENIALLEKSNKSDRDHRLALETENDQLRENIKEIDEQLKKQFIMDPSTTYSLNKLKNTYSEMIKENGRAINIFDNRIKSRDNTIDGYNGALKSLGAKNEGEGKKK